MNSLVEESKEVSHDNDDSPWQGNNDLLDLVHSFCKVFNFCNIRIYSSQLRFKSHRERDRDYVAFKVRKSTSDLVLGNYFMHLVRHALLFLTQVKHFRNRSGISTDKRGLLDVYRILREQGKY